ncbi:MAG: signal peptide peptidase SppA [Cytophagales bacterium]|nr:signal peptide peptidase SppA [Rhizobacter sp.]
MPATRFATTRRWFGRFWWLLDATRRTLFNLVFLLILVVVVVAIATSGPPKLEDNTALVLNLRGPLVEQHPAGIRDAALAQLAGDAPRSTQLRDVLSVLDAATKDPKITRAVLVLDEFKGGGLAGLREVAAALQRFRASGKQVVAWGSAYDQRQYYLAAQANEVFVHPMGMVFMQGFGRYQNYYRDALDKVGVTVNLVRVGTYKSFGETFTSNGPSAESVEANAFLYNALWGTYTEGVEKARKLPAGSVMAMINELPQRLAAAGGDPAKLSLASKLVDGLKTKDELRQMMIERGAKDAEGKTFRQVSFDAYLARQKPQFIGDAVGVVVAEGEIIDGGAPAGTVGGSSTAELIRKARDDKSIKALVLRVNSPGGAVFGSELIRRELELTRAAGKPVVVSMGDVAASGGYWVSMASDEVMADPGTITGSIGVFALLPSADKALEKIGVHTAGTTTTWLAGAGDPRLPPDPRFTELLQTAINQIYSDFTTRVAQARKTTPDKIDAVAQGRVWTGAQAKERGLIDTLGGYREALKSATTRAKLPDDARVVYLQPEAGRAERLLQLLGAKASQALAAQFDLQLKPIGVPNQVVQEARQELGWLVEMTNARKPFAAITHCLCMQP